MTALAIISFCIFAFSTFKEMKTKKYELWNAFLPALGILGTLLILISGTTLFTKWLTVLDGRNSRFVFYAIGAIPIIQIMEYLSLYFGGKCIYRFIKNELPRRACEMREQGKCDILFKNL